jgi:hypothetical protein
MFGRDANSAITTAYRRVLAELIAGHVAFADKSILFPGYEDREFGYLP